MKISIKGGKPFDYVVKSILQFLLALVVMTYNKEEIKLAIDLSASDDVLMIEDDNPKTKGDKNE